MNALIVSAVLVRFLSVYSSIFSGVRVHGSPRKTLGMYGVRVVEARIKAASAFFGGETGTWMASRHLFPFPFFPLHLGIFPYFVFFSFLFSLGFSLLLQQWSFL